MSNEITEPATIRLVSQTTERPMITLQSVMKRQLCVLPFVDLLQQLLLLRPLSSLPRAAPAANRQLLGQMHA